MRYCPRRRDEYEDWVETCVDCGAALVDELPMPVEESKPAPAEPLVTLATYDYPLQAHLSRARLESAGIRAFVTDEHMVNANWLYTLAIGGVRLLVKESNVEKARSVLKEVSTPVSGAAPDDAGSSEDERCPECHSNDIRYETFRIRPIFIQ